MNVPNLLQAKAEELAARPYRIEIIPDTLSDGSIVYVAIHPDLPGCMAQGNSSEEALSELNELRVEYIHHMLKHGLSIPDPQMTS